MANSEIGRRQFLLTAAGAVVLPRFVSASAGAAGVVKMFIARQLNSAT